MNLEILKILTETAITEIARINNTSEEMARFAVESGNENACRQFQKLFQVGVNEINKMAA